MRYSEIDSLNQWRPVVAHRYINVPVGWWMEVYREMEAVGMKCQLFDWNNWTMDIECINLLDVAKNMGDECACAVRYVESYKVYSDGEYDGEIDSRFLDGIKDLYLQKLSDLYDYLVSDDAVIASIDGYDFDSFGNTVSVTATQPVIIGFDALCTPAKAEMRYRKMESGWYDPLKWELSYYRF